MHGTSGSSSVLVIDASVAVWSVLPSLPSITLDTSPLIAAWRRTGVSFHAPMLWMAECTSAIRQGIYRNEISPAMGHRAIEALIALEVRLEPLTASLCHSALDWAGRLQQAKPYDSFYLAVAEQLGAEFWTADRRLANGARQAGAANVRWIGEAASLGE